MRVVVAAVTLEAERVSVQCTQVWVGAPSTVRLQPRDTIEIVTEGPTVGADLTILNDGVIRKRGAGTALLRGCFDPSGTGSIVTDAGANPPTIVSLTCP